MVQLCSVAKSEILSFGLNMHGSASSDLARRNFERSDSGPDSSIHETSSFAYRPRIFSLQKIVEVADHNMNLRSRLDWSKIWKILAGFFVDVITQLSQASSQYEQLKGSYSTGLTDSSYLNVALYAIDSLRQLSYKFCFKPELRDFHFQKMFLGPFQVLPENSMRSFSHIISIRW